MQLSECENLAILYTITTSYTSHPGYTKVPLIYTDIEYQI